MLTLLAVISMPSGRAGLHHVRRCPPAHRRHHHLGELALCLFRPIVLAEQRSVVNLLRRSEQLIVLGVGDLRRLGGHRIHAPPEARRVDGHQLFRMFSTEHWISPGAGAADLDGRNPFF
jgi:hypothetical protein